MLLTSEFHSMNITTMAGEFSDGKVLLFNKPLYWTSFDLVNKVKSLIKHRLNLKKIKVGHAGTLDPLATGLLIICTGKETKNIEKYQSQPKEYLARIQLGATTPSFDLESAIDANYPIGHIDQSLVEKTLEGMIGTQMQVPPDFSARMINGTRAYKLARKGETLLLQPKEITIYALALSSCDLPAVEIRVLCSKGTYIRALARDIGLKLNAGAYLSGLIRTGIGDFLLKDALNIDDFERNFVAL
jgi:tRNA pseudouridine55 synthase